MADQPTETDTAFAEHLQAKQAAVDAFAQTLTDTTSALAPAARQLEAILADDCAGDCCSAFHAADAEATLTTVLRGIRDLARITRIARIDLDHAAATGRSAQKAVQ